MIRTLRTRLVAAAMLSLLVVLTVILGVILLGSYRGIVSDADRILDLLAEGEGTFPTLPADFNWEEEGPRRRSPELGYEIRYFSVLLDESGNVATTDLGQIAAVDQETAEAYAQQVRAQGHTRGFLQDYRYLTAQEGDQTRVIFLDYSGYLFTFRSTLFTGLWVSAVGLLAVFLLLLLLSRRIIRPILESYEKQKRFITDAGHELKTPIAIIQADTDVLTLETGEGNEWIDDIQHQVRRLSTLTNDLIYLSRMEEPQRQTAFLTLPFSDLVAETAQSFQAVAKSQGKTFSLRIQPTLTLVGEEKSLGQLVSILLDNALKYSPPGGEITVTLARQGKSLLLTVANTAQTLSKELLENMFDRLYRGDKARSSEQGGYGIGLSIAKAVVQSHKGKISAAARGDQLVMTVVLPAGNPMTPAPSWGRGNQPSCAAMGPGNRVPCERSQTHDRERILWHRLENHGPSQKPSASGYPGWTETSPAAWSGALHHLSDQIAGECLPEAAAAGPAGHGPGGPDPDPRRGGGAGDLRLPGRCVPDGPVFGGTAGVCRPPDQGLHLPP